MGSCTLNYAFFYLLLTQWDFTLAVVNKWNPFSYLVVNPLTPVPPINIRDKPWPFFHFWCHLFWPKLSSSILNFFRRKRSFKWCPDWSDRLNGALDMNKNAQKVEQKTQTKISCHYTWLLHAKICSSWWRFLRSFLTTSKPSRRSLQSLQQTEKKRRKKEDEKKK